MSELMSDYFNKLGVRKMNPNQTPKQKKECDDILAAAMIKNKRWLDKSSPDYQPQCEDFNLTLEEFTVLFMTNPGKYWDMVNGFKLKHVKNVTVKELVKGSKKIATTKNHWYYTLDELLIVEAVEKSRSLCEEAMAVVQSKNQPERKRIYNERLIQRVLHDKFQYDRPLDSSKLRRFPRYNADKREIYGSPYALMTLWITAFPKR